MKTKRDEILTNGIVHVNEGVLWNNQFHDCPDYKIADRCLMISKLLTDVSGNSHLRIG